MSRWNSQTEQDDPKLREILDSAADLPVEQRHAFLDEACGGDGELRAQVQSLLAALAQGQGFLAKPTVGAAGESMPTTDAQETEASPIGPYKLLQKIGEGGMGVVFMAEQTQPMRRKVALKIIKPGMNTRQVIARFEAERQALAVMDHPNIAKVLDAGTTPGGRPYFVMELVKGVPITKYCDEHRLALRARLELFIPVCQAVQHAHQKGIIHRDLKPSNVLIAMYDGKPVAKVIDFGVAKATGPRLTEKTLFTGFGEVVGTLEYMSPEQAELNQLDIDTRSDIYSLGVLLYELLTGTTPLDRERLKKTALAEVLRVIKEEEPPKPSTRLSTMRELPSVAASRGLEPKQLSGFVKGELDCVVMKALEKDRSRRYESANGLATDLERYLKDEPVGACPPSASYRLLRLVRRHKATVLAGALVAAALVSGTVLSTWQAIIAKEAKQRAIAAAKAEEEATRIAQARQAEMQAVLEFLERRVLAAARPEGQRGGLGTNITLLGALEAALPFVDDSFRDQPLIEARLRMTLGTSFWYVGREKLAAEQFERARTLYARHRGPEHPDTLWSIANSHGRLPDAVRLFEDTLPVMKVKLGRDHPDTLVAMSNLAQRYREQGRYAEALKLLEEVLVMRKAKLGPEHPDTLNSLMSLGIGYNDVKRHADGLRILQETLETEKRIIGPSHPDTLHGMTHLAGSYAALGMHVEALRLREETLALLKLELGPQHRSTLRGMHSLANSYFELGRYTEALKLVEETLALQQAKLGQDHPQTLNSMLFKGMCLYVLGREMEAVTLQEQTLALRKTHNGAAHPDTLRCMSSLSWTLATCADTKLRNYQRALEMATTVVELDPHRPTYWNTLGVARYRVGDFKGAVEAMNKSMDLQKRGDAYDWFFVAMAQWQLGQKDEARILYAKAVQWMEKDAPQDQVLRRFGTEAANLLDLGENQKEQEGDQVN
jgi:eukaryotic-like serine/threonine-protein kinase